MQIARTSNAALGPFIGRRCDLDRLRALIETERLITVVGPPGMGKTRLAHQLGMELRTTQNPTKTWFCDLSLCVTQAAMLIEIARTLKVQLPLNAESHTWTTLIGEALEHEGAGLLICDNVEQLPPSKSKLFATWLGTTTQTTFLVTSRERLKLEEGSTYQLQALTLPTPGLPVEESESVQLFVEHARRRRRRELSLDGDQAEHIAEIVCQLDGIPLAIQLAAARTQVMGLASIRARLQNRFALLSQGYRNAHPRQATLWGAIDWSWQLLSPSERSVLCQCAIFHGGFSHEAARAVVQHNTATEPCFDVAAQLHALADKSLLRIWKSKEGSDVWRFGFYVSIADYARRKLQESDMFEAVALRHARWYAPKCWSWRTEETNRPETAVSSWLDMERDNLQVVFERMTERAANLEWLHLGIHAVLSLTRVRIIEGSSKWHSGLVKRTLTLCDNQRVDPVHHARLLASFGGLSRIAGKLDDALHYLLEAVHLLERSEGVNIYRRIDALTELGIALHKSGDMERAGTYYTQAHNLLQARDSERQDDLRIEARLLGCLARFNHERGKPTDLVKADYINAIEMCRRVKDTHSEAVFLLSLGDICRETSELDQARTCYENARTLMKRQGDRHHAATALANLGTIAQEEGRFEAASNAYTEALVVIQDAKERRSEGLVFQYIATTHHQQGAIDEAIKNYTQAIVCLKQGGGKRALGMTLAFLGIAQAMTDRVTSATSSLSKARQHLEPLGDPILQPILLLSEAQLQLAQWRLHTDKTPDYTPIENLLADPPSDQSRDIRLVAIFLKAALTHVQNLHTWHVDVDGEGFEGPGQPWVNLKRRRSLGLILKALTQEHLNTAHHGLSVDALFAAGWPGEDVNTASKSNRVYVAMATLRKLGLRTILLQHKRSYHLDPKALVSLNSRSNLH